MRKLTVVSCRGHRTCPTYNQTEKIDNSKLEAW